MALTVMSKAIPKVWVPKGRGGLLILRSVVEANL